MEEIEFQENGRVSKWWGYSSYYCDPPKGGSRIYLPYAGEPPHGDSYHKLIIDSKTIRGYVWSNYFVWSKCGRYFTCDWLEGMKGYYRGNTWVPTDVLRATIVADTQLLRYRIVLEPSYVELHESLTEGKEDKLWGILLDPNGAKWENFR
jgi:hypothetical protein